MSMSCAVRVDGFAFCATSTMFTVRMTLLDVLVSAVAGDGRHDRLLCVLGRRPPQPCCPVAIGMECSRLHSNSLPDFGEDPNVVGFDM
jgi:hypothetical protein